MAKVLQGWHESRYLANAAAKDMAARSETLRKIREWLARLDFGSGDDNPGFPRKAIESLALFDGDIAREMDRMEADPAPAAPEDAAPPQDLHEFAQLLIDREFRRSDALGRISEDLAQVLDWLKSFIGADAAGSAYARYRADVATSLANYGALLRDEVRQVQEAHLVILATATLATSGQSATPEIDPPRPPVTPTFAGPRVSPPSVEQPAPAPDAAPHSGGAAPAKAAATSSGYRDAGDLAKAVSGSWLVTVTNAAGFPGQGTEHHTVHQARGLLGRRRHGSWSVDWSSIGWHCTAQWEALGPSSIRIHGVQSLPWMLPGLLEDVLTVNVVDPDHLTVRSGSGRSMSFARDGRS
jgi:hypothetical protein